ncbi:DNA-binding MarR family transcriptional regulator [Sedimentibacter acidaminivorans]|uniref:DNA-binding MarR family transcriptional regulator n=1 Tax=Sedimentibacter acidaminivorans TaxID=913099 RepID=A0ABS4GA29_9FIRM|nr:MarR family transcriptional regulator [Sedimentibacter acidaminivorans]MBP1924541.1 DNA-binding MarR family transcriptional regulator [Sedimentibacter acidaminivorans]
MEGSNIDIQGFAETLDRLAKAEWRKQPVLGVKRSEARILLCIKNLSLEGNEAITVSEISKRMHVTSPTVTQLIKNLNENGYVERAVDSNDKRFVDITLTDKGEKIVKKATDHLNVLFKGLVEKLGEEQCRKLIVLFEQVCEYLEETHIEID